LIARACGLSSARRARPAARSAARLARIDTALADVRRRIANLGDQLEVEIDDESRNALRERKARHVKTRRDLEAARRAGGADRAAVHRAQRRLAPDGHLGPDGTGVRAGDTGEEARHL
jgi:hypothetical protein